MSTAPNFFNIDQKISKMINSEIYSGGDDKPTSENSTGKNKKYSFTKTKIVGNKNKLTTEQNYEKILSNYELIPKERWASIDNNTYIRYMTKDNQLKSGGRVKCIDKKPDGTITITISKFIKGKAPAGWSVNSKNILSIYEFKQSTMGVNGGNGGNGGEDQQGQQQYNQQGQQGQYQQGQPQYNQQGQLQQVQSAKTNLLLDQLGDKFLFDDKEVLQAKLESLETKVQNMETGLKNMFLMLKKIHGDFYRKD